MYTKFLQIIHSFYVKIFGTRTQVLNRILDIEEANRIMTDVVCSNAPQMVSRFGAVEISAVTNYIGVKNPNHSIAKYIKGEQPSWWWNEGIRRCMTDNAGFFPNTNENLSKFGELMLEDMKQIDVLGSWQNDEYRFVENFPDAKILEFLFMDPFWAKTPWTLSLKGKKILVIHPFAKEIKQQFEIKDKLFDRQIWPDCQLITLQSVQSIGGNSNFKSWFEALDYMKIQIKNVDFDVALLGCGAYGMPLAAHIKRMGKKAIHIGGNLQLYFGIKGKRWENVKYAYNIFGRDGVYTALLNNENWIRPGVSAQVKNADRVDNGCYW